MSRKNSPNGFAALFSALFAALQWRILLWWALALGLPTLLLALPLWSGLNAQFAHSTHAADVAAGHDAATLIRGYIEMNTGYAAANHAGALAAFALSLLLSPWLTGMVVASIRAGHTLKLGELAHAGLAEYWRMFRLTLWSLIPLGIAFAIGAVASGVAKKLTEHAVLESQVQHAHYVALAVFALAFVFMHATLEAARGWLGAETSLRSVFRAWWRGFKLVLRRPLASAIVWIGAAIAGAIAVALFGWLRIKLDGAGFGSFVVGWLLTQLIVFAITWSRVARVYAFAKLAKG